MNQQILNRETIAPRSASWQQIEVTGEHPAALGDRRVVQVIDDEAIRLMNAEFKSRAADPDFDGVLVDADHLSHDLSAKTEAYAWLMNTEIRDGQLYGLVEWTDLGASAVINRRYKFFSTEYDAGDLTDLGSGKVRPTRLAGLALTNRPNNKGGKRITNRKADEVEAEQTQPKTNTMNPSMLEKLGLDETATEDDINAALDALIARAGEADTMKKDAEVEEILNRHATRLADAKARETWKGRLLKNRETQEILAEMPEIEAPADKTEGRPAITNRASAAVPGADRAHGTADPAADEKARAARIKNRAAAIQKENGVNFQRAWSQATAEVGH